MTLLITLDKSQNGVFLLVYISTRLNFSCHNNSFCKVHCVEMLMTNNIISNLSIDNWFQTNNLIMKTIIYLIFEINILIVNNGLLKIINMDWLAKWIVKRFKISYWIHFEKNHSQMLVMDFWKA
jgi:hypothetical protein